MLLTKFKCTNFKDLRYSKCFIAIAVRYFFEFIFFIASGVELVTSGKLYGEKSVLGNLYPK